MSALAASGSGSWWHTPLLTGLFALIGVLIAQGIVLYLARKNERRRSDPELLKQCATFSSAAGRLKREIAMKPRDEWTLDSLDTLQDAADSITIIGTPEIEDAAGRLIGYIPLVLDPEEFEVDADRATKGIFNSHREFIDAVRQYFHKPPKVYKAVPMIRRPGSPDKKPLQAD